MLVPLAQRTSLDTGERLLNCTYRPTPEGGHIIGRFGSAQRAFLSENVRALCDMDGVLYGVAGGKLWRVLDGVAVGELPDDPATRAASNGSSIAIVAAGNLYVYNGTRVIDDVSMGGLDVAVDVAYSGGYICLVGHGQGRKDLFQVSELSSATEFDGLDWATAETQVDPLVGVEAHGGQLWLMGTRTVEVWYNSGDLDFPFARNPSFYVERGCLSGRTIAKEDNGVFWVGNDRVVYRGYGAEPQAVSNRALEEHIQAGEIEAAFIISDRGHKFYVLRMESGTSHALDITTMEWCEWSTGRDYGPYFGTCVEWTEGQQYIGTDDGRVVTIQPETYADGGSSIVWEVVSPPATMGGAWFRPGRVRATFKSGREDIGRTPKVILQTSQDGVNWSDSKETNLGKRGEYYKLASWEGLGAFQQMFLRIRITDPVQRDLRGVTFG